MGEELKIKLNNSFPSSTGLTKPGRNSAGDTACRQKSADHQKRTAES